MNIISFKVDKYKKKNKRRKNYYIIKKNNFKNGNNYDIKDHINQIRIILDNIDNN